MGQVESQATSMVFRSRQPSRKPLGRIAVLGYKGSGKSTLFRWLQDHGGAKEEIPIQPDENLTAHGELELVWDDAFVRWKLSKWDSGGRCFIRPLFRLYMERLRGVIIVANEPELYKSSITELLFALVYFGLTSGIKLPLLILANKQDCDGSVNPKEVAETMRKMEKSLNVEWFVQGCDMVTGKGMTEGLRWLRSKADGYDVAMEEAKHLSNEEEPQVFDLVMQRRNKEDNIAWSSGRGIIATSTSSTEGNKKSMSSSVRDYADAVWSEALKTGQAAINDWNAVVKSLSKTLHTLKSGPATPLQVTH